MRVLILCKKKIETSLESYGWHCIGLSCKLSKTASYFSRPTCNCLAWTKWRVQNHCFMHSLMIMTGGMWQQLTCCYLEAWRRSLRPSTDINKRVHCVRAGQFTTGPPHTMDDCKLGETGLACSVCDNYQQAINTRAAPRFLLQSMQYSREHFEYR